MPHDFNGMIFLQKFKINRKKSPNQKGKKRSQDTLWRGGDLFTHGLLSLTVVTVYQKFDTCVRLTLLAQATQRYYFLV